MSGTTKVQVLQLSVDQPKSGTNSKTGKPWKLWPVGIRVNENKWYNGTCWSEDEVDALRSAELDKATIEIELFTEEYQGKTYEKFKMPKRNLHAEVDSLKKALRIIFKKFPELAAEYSKGEIKNTPPPAPPPKVVEPEPVGADDLPF